MPVEPFSPGETVTVRGKRQDRRARTTPFAFHFVVAEPDVLPYVAPTPPSGKDPNEVQHFHSRPDLQPPVLAVTARSAQASPGDIFVAPYAGPGHDRAR